MGEIILVLCQTVIIIQRIELYSINITFIDLLSLYEIIDVNHYLNQWFPVPFGLLQGPHTICQLCWGHGSKEYIFLMVIRKWRVVVRLPFYLDAKHTLYFCICIRKWLLHHDDIWLSLDCWYYTIYLFFAISSYFWFSGYSLKFVLYIYSRDCLVVVPDHNFNFMTDY